MDEYEYIDLTQYITLDCRPCVVFSYENDVYYVRYIAKVKGEKDIKKNHNYAIFYFETSV